jgi:hypothetical protein
VPAAHEAAGVAELFEVIAAAFAVNPKATTITITNVVTLRISFDLLRFFISIPPYSLCGVTLIRNERKTPHELPVRSNKTLYYSDT